MEGKAMSSKIAATGAEDKEKVLPAIGTSVAQTDAGRTKSSGRNGAGAAMPCARQQRWLLEKPILARLFDEASEQYKTLLAERLTDEEQRCACVSWGGRRPSIFSGGESPIESTIEHESWAAGRRAYRGDRRIPRMGDDDESEGAKAARLHLALTEEHRPLEGPYWVLRSAENFPGHLVAAVEHIENHIWRWMVRGEVSESNFEEDALKMMNRQLDGSRKVFRDAAVAIMRVAPILDDAVAVETLRKTHFHISAEMNAMEDAMDALLRMLEKRPTNMTGWFAWLDEMNTIRKAVGLRVMPTPFGLKRLGKRAAARARRVASKAIQAFSRFGTRDEVQALTEGKSISAVTKDGWLDFRIKSVPKNIEVMEEDEVVSIEIGNVAEIPRIEVYTRDGALLAKVCVYVEDTPILDQITGLKLMIESGNEADLITQGNWFDIEDHLLFEQLVVNRYRPVHVIDGYLLPQTRRLYGATEEKDSRSDEMVYVEAYDEWRPVKGRGSSVDEDPSHGAFVYDSARFDPLVGRARKLAMSWLWDELKAAPGVLDVAVRAKLLIWPEKVRSKGSYDRLGRRLLVESVRGLSSLESGLLLAGTASVAKLEGR